MGENEFAPITVSIYAALLLMCGISYTILQNTITACHKENPELKGLMKKQNRKAMCSIVLYTSAIGLAWLNPYISVGIFFFVAIVWLVPDKGIEKVGH